jgi:hypothetical protein
MRLPLMLSLCLVASAMTGCVGTQRVLLHEPLPAVPVEQVRVYSTPPAHYREIARIETASGIGFGTQGQTDSAIEKLRREAAAVGADGVLLLGVDTVGTPVGIGIGAGSFGSHGGAFGSVGIPTAQRRAVGIAIHVSGDQVNGDQVSEPPRSEERGSEAAVDDGPVNQD